MGALDGIRVLDLSQGAAGPICTMYLGDLGAAVVKVEPPGGEWGRQLGPPFVGDVAAAFIGMNRNKRSLSLDVARPEGRRVLDRLLGSLSTRHTPFNHAGFRAAKQRYSYIFR